MAAQVTRNKTSRQRPAEMARGLYGKVFSSIYDGTLYGHWEAIVTMQQFIVLASPDGIVDMTLAAISARTSIPVKILEKGVAVLEEPDPFTRTPGDEGRRIVLIDPHRPWGWRIVNHAKYMRLRNMEQKREADRSRVAEKRKQISNVASVSRPVANVAHSYSDTDSNTVTTNGSQARLDTSPVLEKLPLREGGEFDVRQSLVAALEPLYPAVDIPATLKEMKGWLVLNTERRKTRRGIRKFIGNWLQSEQEKHGR